MTRFRYRAVSGAGEMVTGELDASSRADATRLLRLKSLDPISLHEGARSRLLDLLSREVLVSKRHRMQLRRDFARDLAMLRDAGAPLDEALLILAEGSDEASKLARRVAQRSATGMSLSECLATEERFFDQASIALIESGEASGNAAESLRTLADVTDTALTTRSELVKSLLYPAVLVVASLVAIGLMVFHVLPSFERLFAGSPRAAPGSAQLVFVIGRHLREAALPLGIAALVVVAALVVTWLTESGRRRIDRILLRLPVVGRLLAATELGRTLLVAGRLLAAGVIADKTIELASRTCLNSQFRSDLHAAAERIREGAGVAQALDAAPYVPERVIRMIAIGEASGALPRMLGEIARMEQDAANARIKAVVAALPPILTVVMGIVIAGLIYAVLSALLSLNELAF